jgi:hypothetical protein
MSWKMLSWLKSCLIYQAAQFITAIVRMLGKAVKVRHCPATVSATRLGSFTPDPAQADIQPGAPVANGTIL